MAEDYSHEIRVLEEALNSGVRSVTIDGVTTSFSTEAALRKRINELRLRDAESLAGKRTRPVMVRIGLGGGCG